jgi:hypothetical protein
VTVVDLARPRLRSYTAMTVYMECPRQYQLKYVEKLRDDPAVWNVGGTAFHQCAEWYLTGEPMYPSIEGAWLEAWSLAYQEVMQRNPEANPDMDTWRAANGGREHVAWWMKHGPIMVDDFIEWRKTKARDLVVLSDSERKYIEHRFEVELGGVPTVAIPDALVIDEHGQLNILDWKSGRRAPTGSLQLGTYRAAVLAGLGMDAVWGHYYLTRKAVLLPYDLTVWTPEHIGGLFADFDARERAGDYRPKPGDACKFCPATRLHCTYSTKDPE